MKSLPPFTPFTTGLFSSLHLKSTRARLLALFVFVALLSTAAFAATSIGSVRGFFFGKSSGAAERVETNSSSVARHSVSLSSAVTADGPLNVARKGHSATVLSDGKVLIVGGENQSGFVTEAEIFDPATGSFSVSGNLSAPRADHSATRLSDGRVLIAGGRGATGALDSTEIFDPTSGAFSNGPSLSSARAGHTATALADGRLVFTGGDAAGSVEIYDVSAGTAQTVGAMSAARSNNSAALLLDGRVLIVGGRDAEGNALSSGEIFDPATGSISALDNQMTVARVRSHLRVLFDGKVQVIGGSDDGSLEVYDPQINAFGAYVHVAPEGDTCAGLPGQVQGSQTRAALFHNGQADATFDRSSHTMSELGTQATVVGGANSSGAVLSSAPLFSSSTAEISTDKLDYAPGQTVYITGRGFAPGETVRLRVHEDPHTPLERGSDVIADADGNFAGEYVAQQYDLNMKFLVGARGLTSGRTAQTSFTDAASTTFQGWRNTAIEWTTVNLTSSNSSYTEGETIPFRFVATGETPGTVHTVVLKYDFSNGGTGRIVDSLGSYNQTVTPTNECTSPATCTTNVSASTWTIPTDGTIPGGAQIAGTVKTYRISNLTFSGYTTVGNQKQITLTYTVGAAAPGNTTTNPVILIGMHLARENEWGPGNGADSAAGASTKVGERYDSDSSDKEVSINPNAIVKQADLSITKSDSPDPVLAGGTLTYTLVVTNNGPNQATGVTVTDNLPASVSFVSCAATNGGTCGGTGNNRTITYATLDAGVSSTITLTTTVSSSQAAGSSISNTASVAASSPADPVSGNNSAVSSTLVKRNTSTSVTSSLNPSTFGGSVTFTATVVGSGAGTGNPTNGGSVEFFDGATSLGTQSLSSGSAAISTSALTVGTHSITAVYSGDTNFYGSTSGALSQVVDPACSAPSSATLLPASQTLKVGDTLTLNATVTGGTAPYNFVYKQGTTTVATHNNINSTSDSYTKTNIVTGDAGSYTVEVTSNGCTGSGTATSGAASVTVNRRTASIAVSFLANPITYGGNTTVTATVTDTDTGTPITPTGTVTFGTDSADNFSPSNTCSLVAGVTGTASCSVTVTPTHASVHNISAAWPGDSSHSAPSNGSAGLTVNPKPVTANITVSNKTYDGNTIATITACTLNGVVSPDTTAEVDCSFGSAIANFVDANAGTGKPVNATGLTLTGTKTSSYSFGGTSSTTANITKAGSTTTITCPASVVYNGTAQTPCTAEATGVGMSPVDVMASIIYGNNTNVGTATVNASWAGDANHDPSNDSETFAITKVTLSVNADNMVKTFGQSDPAPTWTYSGFVNSEGPTPAGLSGAASCSYASHSNNVGTYNSVITCAPGTLSSTNYNFATGSLGNLTINAKNVTVTAQNKTRYYGESDPPFTFTVYGLVSPDTTLPGVTCGITIAHSNAGTYTDAITCTGNTNTNYNVTAYNPGTLTVNPDPTVITLDSKTSGINFECVNNQYSATLTDTITGAGLPGVVLKLTIGTQNTTATTNASGVATFTLVLDQPPGPVNESVGLNGAWTDTNRVAPGTVSRSFTILPNPNVGPGRDGTSLYTGSLFFWTTSSTSSTATLTLSATIQNIGPCNGDITKAKVSFFISSNGGSSFNPVSSAQNLPVGRVDPNDPNLGAASAISQYNIGNSESVTLIVRVVVGGEYTSNNTPQWDLPITIGKPGQANSLMGAAQLNNEGYPYPGSGYLGVNAINSVLSSQIVYNKKGVNPQGQFTVKITTCNRIDGTLEPGCTASTSAKHHTYWIKSNSISELSLISGSASFGAKTNGYEMLLDGSKVNFDSGNSMQIVFTPHQKQFIPGTYAAGYGSNGTCTNQAGCASVVLFRSAGGIWFSSSWGLPGNPASTTPRTLVRNVANGGCLVVGGTSSSTPTISAATAETAAAPSTAATAPVESPIMNAAPQPQPQSVSTFVGAAFVAANGSLKENAPGTSATNADAVPTRSFFKGRVEAINNKTETVFVGDGAVGRNWIVSSFDNSLDMVTSGTAADGRVTVTVRSCNKPDGTVDTRCVAAKPSTHHVYVFESRDFSQSSVVADIATLESTGVMYELMNNGEKRILAKDVAMQIIFVPENQMIPLTIGAAGGFACTEKLGCAAVAARRADGTLWYSGGWALKASTRQG